MRGRRRILAVVEGQGEVRAVPALLRRAHIRSSPEDAEVNVHEF
jgi:hypothetical protein